MLSYITHTQDNMRRIAFIIILVALLTGSLCGQTPSPVSNYSLSWKSPSENAAGSMPCGGGDIGLNVWVEKGELLIYLARTGILDENNTLLKAGRLRLRLSPNPFMGGSFEQTLHLDQGFITVSGKNGKLNTTVSVWVDVWEPVVHLEIESNQNTTAQLAYENWRYRDRILTSWENNANSWKWTAPKNTVLKKDSIQFQGNAVEFYHHNGDRTIFDTTVTQQGLNTVKQQIPNPLANRIAGGRMYGKNFRRGATSDGEYAGTDFRSWTIRSAKAVKKQDALLVFYTKQTASASNWQHDLLTAVEKPRRAHALTIQWWNAFWQRSFIEIDGTKHDAADWEIGRNYQLFRYMMACNATGEWPTKFNGGLFTVDPVFADTVHKGLTPDFRKWANIYTAQNQRLLCYPMLKNGDFDLMKPQLDFYLRLLPVAELRSKFYWGHDGACFSEQLENFGLPNFAEYGARRPATAIPGVEHNAWLEYDWEAALEFCFLALQQRQYCNEDISRYIPLVESCLRFFDEHYQYLARQRGVKPLDENGHLVLYPGSAGETFKMAYNANSTIAALRVVTQRLLDLPSQYLDDSTRIKWNQFLQRIPPLSTMEYDGHPTLAPALHWERVNNTETMQLYPVFPWGLYGVGKNDLELARNTYRYDTFAIRFRSHVGWKQDNIWAAKLGLADEAWELTAAKLANGNVRFPAFWGPGYDWLPDHNWGASGMIGLQEMLLQTDGKRILLFPAWDKKKDVHFKLHAPFNTIIEANLVNGKLVQLEVTPASRRSDVKLMLPQQ